MRRKLKWDDINLEDEYWYQGDPILFTNPEIRRMLHLAGIGPNDVFYDLGCGFGQNLIIALAEFKVGRAIGIELDKGRAWRANVRLRELGLESRGKVLEGDFKEVLSPEHIKKATAIFYGVESEEATLSRITRYWRKCAPGRRLIYYERHLIPEIMPKTADPPFFVSESYFKPPVSEREWLSKVVLQPESILERKEPTRQELWDELVHNLDVLGVRDNIEDYRLRLRDVVKKNTLLQTMKK
jgi:precorrin-6B methylase 2